MTGFNNVPPSGALVPGGLNSSAAAGLLQVALPDTGDAVHPMRSRGLRGEHACMTYSRYMFSFGIQLPNKERGTID